MTDYLNYNDTVVQNIDLDKQEDNIKKLLQDLEENKFFQKFSNTWNSISEKDKEKIYNSGDYSFTIKGSMKRSIKLGNPITSPLRGPLIRLFEKETFKEQITKDSLELSSSAVRFMVHLGLLQSPSHISNEVITRNIQKDAKNIKRQISVFEKVAMVVPALRPIVPIIQKLKPLIKTSSNLAEKIMLEKQKNVDLTKTIKNTNENLENLWNNKI